MEWKVPVHRDEKFMGVHKPRLMDVGEGKSDWKSSALKDVERQREKSGNRKGIEEHGGVRSTVSMNRLNKGLAEGVGNCSNVSKTIDNQGLEGWGGNFSNASKKIEKPGLEEGGGIFSNVSTAIEKQGL